MLETPTDTKEEKKEITETAAAATPVEAKEEPPKENMMTKVRMCAAATQGAVTFVAPPAATQRHEEHSAQQGKGSVAGWISGAPQLRHGTNAPGTNAARATRPHPPAPLPRRRERLVVLPIHVCVFAHTFFCAHPLCTYICVEFTGRLRGELAFCQ